MHIRSNAARTGNQHTQAFERWALSWREPEPTHRQFWYSYWFRDVAGGLSLATEFGELRVTLSAPADAPAGAMDYAFTAASDTDTTTVELERIRIDASGATTLLVGTRHITWKRTAQQEWDDFGFLCLLTTLEDGLKALGRESVVGEMLTQDLLKYQIPGIASVRKWCPLRPVPSHRTTPP